MNAPARRERLSDLDALTEQLPERAAALATRLDQVLAGVCVWCCEPVGFCRSTGGRRPCEGQSEQAALMADIADAPTIHIGGS